MLVLNKVGKALGEGTRSTSNSIILHRAAIMVNTTLHAPKLLTGEVLLKRVSELADLPREQKARLCGYSKVAPNGTTLIDVMQFMIAILEAKGISVDSTTEDQKNEGWSTSYRVKVQSNNSIILNSTYTKLLDLQPHDELEVSLGRNHIQLKSMPDDEIDDYIS